MFLILFVHSDTFDVGWIYGFIHNMHCKQKKLSYRKDDRAMRAMGALKISGVPDYARGAVPIPTSSIPTGTIPTSTIPTFAISILCYSVA